MDNLEANIMDKSMRSVFVGNIPYEATEEKLKDIFGEVGQVLSFKLVFDRETGKPKGYGFCEYRDQETALSAMRNLNGYEIGGRNLRVDNACTEKSRMEMQNLLNQPPVENPYGEPIQAEKAPEAISKAVASLPPEQMFELMKQMKLCIQNNPTEARQMLLQNPQLAYALLQAQVVMRIIDPHTACSLLHPQQPVPTTLMPSDKPATGPVPVNSQFTPTPVQPPRQEFQPVPAPVIHNTTQSSSVFTTQDVDLRSLDPRGTAPDPRVVRMGDQDMRTLPSVLPNPLPPVSESFPKPDLTKGESFVRDPREARDPRADPRMDLRADLRADMRIDPRADLRPDPRIDPRADLRVDPRADLRVDPRADLRVDPRADLRVDPRADLRVDPRGDPRADLRADPRADLRADPRAIGAPYQADPRQQVRIDPRQKSMPAPQNMMPPQPVRPPVQPVMQPGIPPMVAPRPAPTPASVTASVGPAGASDQEKAALIMQVLQLSDEQIAMLPPEQRNSILVLKEQIAKSAQQRN